MYIIDRFEDLWAVVETNDRQTFSLPRELLPSDVCEGDVLDITISVDQKATEARKTQAKNLLDNFFDE
ncbi:DUF3006 domain-containing protein [Paradesulfitobacterium aromaticivorans]